MRMIGYLGGDANTLVARRATEEPLKLAVELGDRNQMIAFVVFQTGEVCIGQTRVRGGDDTLTDLTVVGRIHDNDFNDIEFLDKPTPLKTLEPVVEFTRSKVMRGDSE
jgi:hypothetical protein